MRLLFTRQCFDSRSNSRSLAPDLTSNSSNEVEESKKNIPWGHALKCEVRKSGVTWRSAVQSIRKFPWKPKKSNKTGKLQGVENAMIINAGGTSTILNSEDVKHCGTFVLNHLKTHNVKLWICFPLEPAFLRSCFTTDRLVVGSSVGVL